MESGRIIPERKIAEMKPETEKVGIEYVYPQTTTISILPPIILLLLSEGYGSAWQADLSFQLRKTKKNCIGWQWQKVWRPETEKVLYYLSVLWLFHFTNRSPPVYYGWCQEKIKIIAAPCSLFHIILSNLDQRLVRKKNSGKKKGCSYYLLHVPRVIGQKFSQKQKAAKERKKSEMSLLLFLVNWVGSWKRRLVAEEGSLSKKTWLQKINRGWWAPELGPVVGNGYRREVSWNAERLCKWLRGQEI